MSACVHWRYRSAPTIKGTNRDVFKNTRNKGIMYLSALQGACVCVRLRLRQRTHSRVQEARGYDEGEGRNAAGQPAGSLQEIIPGGSCSKAPHTHTQPVAPLPPLTAIYGSGFPAGKEQPGIEEEEEKRRGDCSRVFHWGFRSAAKTIAALESQISVHVKGFRGK